MQVLISLSKMKSPLEEQKVVLENAKDNVKKAQRSEKLARDSLQEATENQRNVQGARKELAERGKIRRRAVDVARIQQQKVGRAGVVDRLINELERLEKTEDTDANKKANEERRASLRKQISEAREAMKKIKLPKSTVKRKKRRR
ncbi:hypothetical protein HOU08_gp191 [Dickeya phage vB_DsoM_JA29]|uniref:Uncharacterized protein n=1 Tax=Dickeya phage vB_DsoM_JA29 TaxID=2283031 RepID=A0A384ZXG2_9CAUD|nr:hypothetical protein HOU08_gp191 [Dickeya phage vB_DsoM_JA29]AXG66917.1 hypothetical protein JA29_191 [Dickeya phage vB_DsoM_JA29]